MIGKYSSKNQKYETEDIMGPNYMDTFKANKKKLQRK